MQALYDVVNHWKSLEDGRIDSTEGIYSEDSPCCHAAHGVAYLTDFQQWSYLDFLPLISQKLNLKEEEIASLLVAAGAPKNPYGGHTWQNRQAVYDRLLGVREV